MTERNKIVEKKDSEQAKRSQEAWLRLRGAGKDVFAELGGGEAYIRKEREDFDKDMERRINLIAKSAAFTLHACRRGRVR